MAGDERSFAERRKWLDTHFGPPAERHGHLRVSREEVRRYGRFESRGSTQRGCCRMQIHHQPPLLVRLEINLDRWLHLVTSFRSLFQQSIGRPSSLYQEAIRSGQKLGARRTRISARSPHGDLSSWFRLLRPCFSLID